MRTLPLSAAPLPLGALRLACVGCLARTALAAGVAPEPDAVGAFMDERCMGSCQACWQIMGHSQYERHMPGTPDAVLF